ncbi:pentatricopeptide repeat-containing protein At4g02750 [Cryptomeria japonica]|uniref:pentatricopeptide repeat-containing protein At4g02750 n=1 Tax=Cryptomeria japonica TaxID=3369 RepID=UPI0025AC8D22|nr:pentatricopeptide repeat-containing protein At4g02750 [Cryptomeria japonica]
MIQTGFMNLGNRLVTMYAKCGCLVEGYKVLIELGESDVVSWTVMISAYARIGCAQEALALFIRMRKQGIKPDHFTFASVLPACVSLDRLKEVHGDVLRYGFQSDVFVGSALVTMYAKCGRVEDACNLFDGMPERNVVSWNAMIAGYSQNGFMDEALKLFQKMPEKNVVSWNSMIAGYAQIGKINEALKLFKQMGKQNVVSWNTMIAGYAQNGFIDKAVDFFWQMPDRNEVSWTAIIAGSAQNGYAEEAVKFYREMELRGMKPTYITFVSVLSACADLAALEQGMQIHQEIVRSGVESIVTVGNALLDMYAKCGSIENAKDLFDRMPQHDVISWNTMITGYAMNGSGKEALNLFEQMLCMGIIPDHVTFVGVLSACCHIGQVDMGWRYFHSMSQDYHINPSIEHYTCVVDLLGRAGLMSEAYNLICKMPTKPGLSVWRCLLGACSSHNNKKLGELVADHLFELNPESDSPYVLMSNICAAAGQWSNIEVLRKRMKDRGVTKKPGCSWIEVDKQLHAFLVGDKSQPQTDEIMGNWRYCLGR